MKYQKKVVQIEAYKLGSENVPQWFANAIDEGRIESPMFRNYVLLNTQKGPDPWLPGRLHDPQSGWQPVPLQEGLVRGYV